jgi:CDP-glucose 4,6-dehydratase
MHNNYWNNRTVLVTGHTGFKGWWLSHLLKAYGAKIYGVSKASEDYEVRPRTELNLLMTQEAEINLIEYDKLREFLLDSKPSVIFHLAANAIVKDSFMKPHEYILENTVGTLNLLELLRKEKELLKTQIMISTTDKVYKNNDALIEYKESDSLWGEDPYSASKVCVEQILYSYARSFSMNDRIRISRAGNVIGGADRGNFRLVPYIIESVFENKNIELRFPDAIRPWQHVLDVISSYLSIAEYGFNYPDLAYNIAPVNKESIKVVDLVNRVVNSIKISGNPEIIFLENKNQLEKKNLSLNSSLIKNNLNLANRINTDQMIELTVNWEKNYYKGGSPSEITMKQIDWYLGEQLSK